MICPLHSEETAGILLDYTARTLDPATVAMLDRHMASCASCAAFRDDQAAVWAALDAWEAEPASQNFERNLWAGIEAEAGAPWHAKIANAVHLGTWRPIAPLAVAAIAIMAVLVFQHRPDRQAAPGVSAAEAAEVEETLDDIQLLYQLAPATAEPQ